MTCRHCRDDEDRRPLVQPCACRGSAKWIHQHCLEQWRRTSLKEDAAYRCGQCMDHYRDELAGGAMDKSSDSSDSEQGALTLQRKRTASMAFSDREGGEANPVTSPCSSGPPLTAEPSKEPRPDGPLHKRPRGRAPNGTNGLSMQWSGSCWVESAEHGQLAGVIKLRRRVPTSGESLRLGESLAWGAYGLRAGRAHTSGQRMRRCTRSTRGPTARCGPTRHSGRS